MKLHHISPTAFQLILWALLLLILIVGTVRDPEFWRSATRHGDHLFHEKKFAEAAKVYADPARIGAAQFRNGDFEAAAKTFARVPGDVGAFNQANSQLMHGSYDAAVDSYNRALGFRPRWKVAEDNKAIAVARKKQLDDSGKDRDQESAEAFKPDEIVFDQNGEDKKGEESEPKSMNGDPMSDDELRASWLRRVQTTPGDFLRAKFAYQAAHASAPEAKTGDSSVTDDAPSTPNPVKPDASEAKP